MDDDERKEYEEQIANRDARIADLGNELEKAVEELGAAVNLLKEIQAMAEL